LEEWVEEAIVEQDVESGRGVQEDDKRKRFTLEEFVRDVVGRMSAAFDLTRGYAAVKSFAISPESVSLKLRKVLGEINSKVPYPKLTDRPNNLGKGLATFLRELDRPYFRVPGELKTTLGLGAARVGEV